jgi:hypothetical protein
VEWVVREGVGAGGRNEPSLVCTYALWHSAVGLSQHQKARFSQV